MDDKCENCYWYWGPPWCCHHESRFGKADPEPCGYYEDKLTHRQKDENEVYEAWNEEWN